MAVVDAKHIGTHLDAFEVDGEANEATKQIAFADRYGRLVGWLDFSW